MTARQVYEGVLIEMNKVQAPSLLLEDFNYLFNKAINQYINKRYNIYDINQQTTDDIRVLKASAVLKPIKAFTSGKGGHASGIANGGIIDDGISGKNISSPYGTVYDVTGMNSLYGATYEAYLPMDYLHLLSCICNFRVNKTFKCYDKNTFIQFAAQRLTSDAWSTIINNFYMRPSYKRPYYYIHNVNTKRDVPTSPNRSTASISEITDVFGKTLRLSGNAYDNIFGLNRLDKYTFINRGTKVKVVTDQPEIVVNTDVKYVYNSDNRTYSESESGTYFKAADGLFYAEDKITEVNTYDYVAALQEIGVYSTGQDMDSLDKNGNAANGYTYGQYTNTESGEGPTGVSNFPRSIIIGDATGGTGNTGSYMAIDAVERPAGQRFGNASQVRLEIRYGKI